MKMPPRKPGHGKKEISKDDPTYKEKRNRNNDAVKKSREKTKQKAAETLHKVQQLKQENEVLEDRIKLLSKELTFLKDIFLAHANAGHGINYDSIGLTKLLADDDDEAVMGDGDLN